jgi:formyl-CoA transferase
MPNLPNRAVGGAELGSPLFSSPPPLLSKLKAMNAAKTFSPSTGPLAGLKVLELGQLIAGPFAAKTLADFGADVVKIEPPGAGDPLRQWRLMKDGTSVWWQVQSRNKQSLALDLKQPAAQDIVRQLAAESDVLIENFRPGAMEGWGLGPDDLLALNPRLIMLRVSGYGQTGPYRDRPGSARPWAAFGT